MILNSNGQTLEIKILRRSNPRSTDFEDGNWLEAEVNIDVISFQARYGTNLRTDDFERFFNDLRQIKDGRSGVAEFKTLEEGLELIGEASRSGNILWKGSAKSSCGQHSLKFKMEVSQQCTNDLLLQLNKILEDFPVVGLCK